MKDGEHDDFVVLLANFVDDDVGAFDEFVGPGIETEAAHSSETRGEEQFELAENPIYQPLCGCRVVFCDPVKNILKIAQRVFLEDEPHSLERATRFFASASDMYFGFLFARRRRNSASCSSVSR